MKNQVEKEFKKFTFSCGHDIAVELIDFLERNHYLTGYKQQFAKEYLMVFLTQYLDNPNMEYDENETKSHDSD